MSSCEDEVGLCEYFCELFCLRVCGVSAVSFPFSAVKFPHGVLTTLGNDMQTSTVQIPSSDLVSLYSSSS